MLMGVLPEEEGFGVSADARGQRKERGKKKVRRKQRRVESLDDNILRMGR